MTTRPEKQDSNSSRRTLPPVLLAYQFKKGQSGNPKGRPAGKTLKEYSRELLANMTQAQRQDFLNGIDKLKIWEMAEGKADTKTDVTSKGEKIVFMPTEVLNRLDNATTPETE